MVNDFAIIGGDLRFFYLAKILHSKNFKIIGFKLANCKNETYDFKITKSLKHAVLYSKNLICPIPFTRNGEQINFMDKKNKLQIKTFIKYISFKNNSVFAGGLSNKLFYSLKNRTNFVYDYLKNEKFAVKNAVLTAETVIGKIVLKNSLSLNSSRCLILGFGRCGKLIALKIKTLCNHVTIATQNKLETTWAKSLGFSTINLNELVNNLNKFKLIVNTIPKRFLKGSILNKINPRTFIFDITSVGISKCELKKRGIDFEIGLQLPGKFKFKESAINLANLICDVLEKN